MQQLSAERHYAEIEGTTAALAGLVDGADLSQAIPTCPEWTLRQLATHVGRAHRWAAEICATRSAEFVPFRSVPDGRFPDDPDQHEPWLNAGAQRVIKAVREAGDNQVWAFGQLAPARFWARRMAHETLVHLSDAELATGRPVTIAADIATDAIDEWLGFLSGPLFGRADPRAEALPEGQVLSVRATDQELAGSGEWLVSHRPSGVTVQAGPGRGTAALSGPAAALLLVLVRRLPPGAAGIEVRGDAGVLRRWLAETPF